MTKNKWEQLFEDFLDTMGFTLVKHKGSDEEYNPFRWSLIDKSWLSLNYIEFDMFADAEGIIERLDCYIDDCFYADLKDEIRAYGVDLDGRALPDGAEEWLALRNSQEFYEKNKRYCDEHKFEFDVLDMIVNHADEINLEECYYEMED